MQVGCAWPLQSAAHLIANSASDGTSGDADAAWRRWQEAASTDSH